MSLLGNIVVLLEVRLAVCDGLISASSLYEVIPKPVGYTILHNTRPHWLRIHCCDSITFVPPEPTE